MKQTRKLEPTPGLNAGDQFDFSPSQWVPFRDKNEINRVLAIKREDREAREPRFQDQGVARCRRGALLDSGHVQEDQALLGHRGEARDDTPQPGPALQALGPADQRV